MNKKLNTRIIRKHKLVNEQRALQMLTCYDYQTAQLLNETILDMILVGDSVGNVVLGYKTTIEVTLEEMIIFSSAVKRGAPDKFVIADLPFGSYSTFEDGINCATKLFKTSAVEAIKLEGAYPFQLQIIQRLVETGIPVMGHIGLTPQSVHELGGYYTHGKDKNSADKLIQEAKALEDAGCFAVVLECVEKKIAQQITENLNIPTIGIGSGTKTDGQVLVLNDLLKIGKDTPPSFCDPISNFYQLKKGAIDSYLSAQILNLGLNKDEKLFIND
ncbi:MAG: 3-methyl-2-oxobutanoate hydroxymethyltransferase [Bacteriovoracaceae bacterium]|nr:3-methyl-2-oxobutanoate hydroxymethyltransferase [Bacteriovoracaceae bacterium]